MNYDVVTPASVGAGYGALAPWVRNTPAVGKG
jgi:hypothetical protein